MSLYATQDEKKQAAAKAALKHLPKGGILGVGTGSTVNFLIDLLPELPNTEDEVGFNNDITDKNKAKLLASNAKREAKDKEGKYAVEDEKKEKKEEPALKKFEETESEGEMIPVFVSGKKKLSNFQDGLQFQLKFAEDLNGVERRDIVDEDGESTGKKERMSMSLGYGFSMLIDESKKATLSKGGVEFSGNLAFPMMKLIGIEGIMPMVEKLVLSPNEELSMRELRLAQMVEEGADPYYVRLGVANSWRFEINKIQVFDALNDQSAFTGFCPAAMVLKKVFGMSTEAEKARAG